MTRVHINEARVAPSPLDLRAVVAQHPDAWHQEAGAGAFCPQHRHAPRPHLPDHNASVPAMRLHGW